MPSDSCWVSRVGPRRRPTPNSTQAIGHTQHVVGVCVNRIGKEHSGERNRGIFVLKSRGMNHSNQIREFILSDRGIQLRDVYVGLGGMVSGTARTAQEAQEAAAEAERLQIIALHRREVDRRRRALQAQITSLQAELEAQDDEHDLFAARQRLAADVLVRAHAEVAATRNRGRAL